MLDEPILPSTTRKPATPMFISCWPSGPWKKMAHGTQSAARHTTWTRTASAQPDGEARYPHWQGRSQPADRLRQQAAGGPESRWTAPKGRRPTGPTGTGQISWPGAGTLTNTEKPPYRFPHTAADGLFAEQVAVWPGAGQRQNQHIILYAVNEQPVRENVTFPMAHPIAGQIVIAVLLRQRFAHRQQRHDLLQQFNFQASPDCPFVVLLKAGCVLDGILRFPHFCRSANNSSRSL